MLSDESAGKAGPPSGPKRSHLAPTSLSWTWLYIHHLQIIWSPITSHHEVHCFCFGLERWGGGSCLFLWVARPIWSLSLLSHKIKANHLSRKTNHVKMFFFFCCHSVAFSRELFSRICFDIFVKLEMSKLALCILYMLQQLPIQLHNASK